MTRPDMPTTMAAAVQGSDTGLTGGAAPRGHHHHHRYRAGEVTPPQLETRHENPAPLTDVMPKYLSEKQGLGVIAVGFSGGQRKLGVDAAPTALIRAGLLDDLEKELDYKISYDGITHTYSHLFPAHDPPIDNMLNPLTVSAATKSLASQVYAEASKGRLTLTLGGDHSIAIGSIWGAAQATLERTGKHLGVIWVDAHADINTPSTTDSGNIHGMPCAFLTGIARHPVFNWMHNEQREMAPWTLPTERLVYIGLRDVDRGEKKILRQFGIKAFSMHDVDRWGIGRVVDMALDWLRDEDGDTGPLYLSFDVDALDPTYAPTTGTPVRGGLTLREGDFICECVHETGCLVGMDLVEVNPALDEKGEYGPHAEETIRAGMSIVRCALGESLL